MILMKDMKMFQINHECTAKLHKSAKKLLKAAANFYNLKQSMGIGAPVQWLQDTAGSLLIFTRGKYREQLLENIATLQQQQNIIQFDDCDDHDIIEFLHRTAWGRNVLEAAKEAIRKERENGTT